MNIAGHIKELVSEDMRVKVSCYQRGAGRRYTATYLLDAPIGECLFPELSNALRDMDMRNARR